MHNYILVQILTLKQYGVGMVLALVQIQYD